MRRTAWAVWLAIGLFCGGGTAAERTPNIVFILADDLGWTDLGCQGSKYYETPHLDRLAAEGLRCTSGYTCGPNCQPTRAALLSGQYGPRTGVYTVGSIERFDWRRRPLRPVDNVEKLPLAKVTFADALRNAGYRTGMFGKWHLGNDPAHHPLARGFDEAIVTSGGHFGFATNPKVDVPADTYLADFLTEQAIEFIRKHQSRPFLLYLPHFGVHSPHQAKEEMKQRFAGRPAAGGHHDPTYAAMIASVDESVGRIVALLEELKLRENTLVTFSSDNGGVGGYQREGLARAGGITDNAPLRSGKGSLYEGGVRVPFLFCWPGMVPANAVSETPIISVDLFPTLLELAGAGAPRDQVLDGTSLVEFLKSGGRKVPHRPALYWHFPGYLGAGSESWRTTPAGAIRAGHYKLIEFFEMGRAELYDLRADLSERTNLADRLPEKTRELQKILAEWRAAVGATMPTANTPEDRPAKPPKTGKGKKRREKAP